jgi:ketosteroid isomerase-like protein
VTPAPLPVELAGLAQRLVELEDRLERFEDAAAIRACVHRYMALCDRLDASTPMDALLDCFTEDAIWAGKGARYGESFGGTAAARDRRHARPTAARCPARTARSARRTSPSTPTSSARSSSPPPARTPPAPSGPCCRPPPSPTRAHLNAAQLTLQMRRDTDGHWRIAHFETENLLSRPVDHWHSDTALPVPRR